MFDGENSVENVLTGMVLIVIGVISHIVSIPALGILSIGGGTLLGILSFGGGAIATITPIITTENEFDRFFNSIDLCNKKRVYPTLLSKEPVEFGYNYIFSLPTGKSIDDFNKIKLSMEQHLDSKIKFSYKDKEVHMLALETKLSNFYPYESIECSPMEIVIGYTNQGLFKIKLKNHMLICGATGFGKSTCEKGILVCLIENNKPSELVLNLCDFKRNELGLFKNSKYVNTFVVDKEGLENLLERLEKEAMRRYDLFEKEHVLDINKYNAKCEKIPHIVTVIDELAQCEGDKKIMGMLQKRISYDRAAGLLYIICTQRPSVDILPGSVKANIDTRICFKTVDSTNSWIVLDDKEAAQYLEIPGRGLIRTSELEEFQAMYISEEEVTEKIKHTFRTEVEEIAITDRDKKIIEYLKDKEADSRTLHDMFFKDYSPQWSGKRLKTLYERGHLKRKKGVDDQFYIYYV